MEKLIIRLDLNLFKGLNRLYKLNCDVREGVVYPQGMGRVAACVEYRGNGYHGFQKQKTAALTIQAALEKSLSRVANEQIKIVCAGRTDAGVHGTNQIIHFDTTVERREYGWLRGGNTYLPDDIVIKWVRKVVPEFHARYSAGSRTYRYCLYTGPVRPGITSGLVTWVKYVLDVSKMEQAAKFLVGEHDFSSIRAAFCQAKSPVRTIYSLTFEQRGPLIIMEVSANAFLHHMVRNIVGLMIEVGRGERPPEWIAEVLREKDRTKAATTAKPDGLYLVNVEYPEKFGLPATPYGPDFLC